MTARIRKNVQAMTAYTPGEQPDDPAIIKLNTNENPYPPSHRVADVLRSVGEGTLRLYPDPLCRRLREAIAKVHGCDTDQVFCGNGSDEILALCYRAFVEDGQAVGYFDPSYSLYPVLADIQACQTQPVPLGDGFDWPALPADYDVALFFWTNPNAPTSLRCPVEPIADFAARSKGVVVVDEAYADFASCNAMKLALSRDNVLVTRSFSKSYSLAGIRLGYAVGPRPLIQALYTIKDSYNVNYLTQEIGRVAMEDQAHMHANADRMIATRERVAKALRAKEYDVLPSETNFLWIRPKHTPAREIFEELRAKKIYVRYFPAKRTSDYLRITIGTDPQMDALLAAL